MQGSPAFAIRPFQGRQKQDPARCVKSQSTCLAFAAAFRRRRFALRASARRSSFDDPDVPFAPEAAALLAPGAVRPASCFLSSFPVISRPKALSDLAFECTCIPLLAALRIPNERIRHLPSRRFTGPGHPAGFRIRFPLRKRARSFLRNSTSVHQKNQKHSLRPPGSCGKSALIPGGKAGRDSDTRPKLQLFQKPVRRRAP